MLSVVARAAHAYARAGYPVLPCRATTDKSRGSKAPHLPGETKPGARDGGHWLATTDQTTIEQWWRKWPEALIGFPTGARTGVVVIDLDPRETPVEQMAAALDKFCGIVSIDPATGEILRPAVAITQSGGAHFYYRWSADDAVTNRTNLFGDFIKHREAPTTLAHIDVRGEGGYVIAPPSIMANGATYVWERRADRDEAGAWRLPPLPPRLMRIVSRREMPRAVQASQRSVAARARAFDARAVTDTRVRRYVEAAIAGVLADLRSAAAGERNQRIYLAACRLGEFVRGGVVCLSEAEELLISNLPAGVSAGEHKALQTIRNGLGAQKTPPFSPQNLGRVG